MKPPRKATRHRSYYAVSYSPAPRVVRTVHVFAWNCWEAARLGAERLRVERAAVLVTKKEPRA